MKLTFGDPFLDSGVVLEVWTFFLAYERAGLVFPASPFEDKGLRQEVEAREPWSLPYVKAGEGGPFPWHRRGHGWSSPHRPHYSIVMIKWTSLAPCEFEFPFPGSRTQGVNLFLGVGKRHAGFP